MAKTLYERDMEDSLRQIAVALGVDVSGTPDVEDVIRAAGKAGKDAQRYRRVRDEDDAFEALKVAYYNGKTPAEIDAAVDAAPATCGGAVGAA